MPKNTLVVRGDARCLPLADASVSAIVTDPPYELGFMGKGWDASGVAFQPETWAQAYRVLKPGGHLLAFGGTRTYHRLAVAIENAGFEIRDSVFVMGWVYAQGFPKSLDVSKAIDRSRRRDFVLAAVELGLTVPGNNLHDWTKAEHSPGDAWWEKFKAALPAEDRQRIERMVVGQRDSGSSKFRAIGPVGIKGGLYDLTASATEDAARWQGWGTALKPAWEPIVVARKPLAGTVAANVLAYGTGALNVDACRVPTTDWWAATGVRSAPGTAFAGSVDGSLNVSVSSTHDAGRWPTNVLIVHHPDCADGCVPGCHAAVLDAQSGTSASRVGKPRGASAGVGWGMTSTGAEYADTGGASRFYPQFRFNPKAPKSERPRLVLGDGTTLVHPTVKPVSLMRWLVRLVTPPRGVVLDPFAGSGATLQAAAAEGFDAVGVELDGEHPYTRLITKRLATMPATTPSTTDERSTTMPARTRRTPSGRVAPTPAEAAGPFALADGGGAVQPSGAYSVDGKPDQYGRYRLPSLTTGVPTAWTRASTWAKTASDTFVLSQWGARMAVHGITQDPGLYALAASTKLEDRDALNAIVERAKEVAGAKTAANLGTALHAFTEARDRGEEIVVPAQWQPDVAAYTAALAEDGLEVMPEYVERILVVDGLNVAGRWDRVYRLTRDRVVQFPGQDLVTLPAGTLVVGDLKTGRTLEYGWTEIAIQLGLYSRATKLFDTETKRYVDPPELEQRVAVAVHLPVGQGTATVYDVDVTAGWAAAEMCADIRAWRKRKGLAVPRSVAERGVVLDQDQQVVGPSAFIAAVAAEVAAVGTVLDAMGGQAAVVHEATDVERAEAAVTRADLAALWEELHPAGRWTGDVAMAANIRAAQLAADRAGA